MTSTFKKRLNYTILTHHIKKTYSRKAKTILIVNNHHRNDISIKKSNYYKIYSLISKNPNVHNSSTQGCQVQILAKTETLGDPFHPSYPWWPELPGTC